MTSGRSGVLFGLVLGAATGAAGLAIYQEGLAPAAEARLTSFVEVQRMTLPLITPEGELSRYAAVDFALEVDAERRAQIRHRLPDLRHHLNVAAHGAPLAYAGDGRIDIEALRITIAGAARKAFPDEDVRGVHILGTQPI